LCITKLPVSGQKGYKQAGCVTLCGLAIYIKKYLKAKEEELRKLKYFTMQNYSNLQKKNPLKETKILQDYIITL